MVIGEIVGERSKNLQSISTNCSFMLARHLVELKAVGIEVPMGTVSAATGMSCISVVTTFCSAKFRIISRARQKKAKTVRTALDFGNMVEGPFWRDLELRQVVRGPRYSRKIESTSR